MTVVPVCAVGDDANGDFLRRELAGADLSHVVRTSGPTSATIVISEADRTFLHLPGGNALLTTDDLLAGIRGCGPGDVVYLAYPLLVPLVDFARVAAAAGEATVAIDVSLPAPHRVVEWRDVVARAAPHMDLLFCNEHEARALAGGAGSAGPAAQSAGWLDLVALALHLKRSLAPFAFRGDVVVHSAIGAALAGGKALHFEPACRVPAERILGTNGAGDAFAAGFLLSRFVLGGSVQEGLWTGCAVAAACITDATPSGGVASVKECLSLASSFGRQGLRPLPQNLIIDGGSTSADVPFRLDVLRPVGAILDLVSARSGRVVVGVTGAGGAGKSTFAALMVWVLSALDPSVRAVALPTDGFHLTNAELASRGLAPFKGRRDTFDIDRLRSVAARLRSSETVPWPVYDRASRDPKEGAIVVPSDCNLAVVEGLWARECRCDLIIHLRGSKETLKGRMMERKKRAGRDWDEEHYARVDEPNFDHLNDAFDEDTDIVITS